MSQAGRDAVRPARRVARDAGVARSDVAARIVDQQHRGRHRGRPRVRPATPSTNLASPTSSVTLPPAPILSSAGEPADTRHSLADRSARGATGSRRPRARTSTEPMPELRRDVHVAEPDPAAWNPPPAGNDTCRSGPPSVRLRCACSRASSRFAICDQATPPTTPAPCRARAGPDHRLVGPAHDQRRHGTKLRHRDDPADHRHPRPERRLVRASPRTPCRGTPAGRCRSPATAACRAARSPATSDGASDGTVYGQRERITSSRPKRTSSNASSSLPNFGPAPPAGAGSSTARARPARRAGGHERRRGHRLGLLSRPASENVEDLLELGLERRAGRGPRATPVIAAAAVGPRLRQHRLLRVHLPGAEVGAALVEEHARRACPAAPAPGTSPRWR